MKIVLIYGQNHKGSTYHIGRMIADKMEGDNEITEFFLPRDLNHFCLGCYQCIEDESRCPFYEPKRRIMDEVEKADLLIFTTPTYCFGASAPMKAFIDLTFTYWMTHQPRKIMFEKKAVVVSTAAGAGVKSAMKDVADTLFYWGVPYIKQYGVAVQAMNWNGVSDQKKAKIEKDTTQLAKAVSHGKTKVGIKTKFIFHMMRMIINSYEDAYPDKVYWKNKGWLDRERPWS